MLTLPNRRWSIDFAHDQLVTGRWFRMVRELTDPIAGRGKPEMIGSDNGTELTSNAVPARSTFARRVDDYDTERPHSSLGYATAAAFAVGLEQHGSVSGCRWMKERGHVTQFGGLASCCDRPRRLISVPVAERAECGTHDEGKVAHCLHEFGQGP